MEKICGRIRYEEICGKYLETSKKYVQNKENFEFSPSKQSISLYKGDGTWKNSKFLLSMQALGLRKISVSAPSNTTYWRSTLLSPPYYRLRDLEKFRASSQALGLAPAPSNTGRRRSTEQSEVCGEDTKRDLRFLAWPLNCNRLRWRGDNLQNWLKTNLSPIIEGKRERKSLDYSAVK